MRPQRAAPRKSGRIAGQPFLIVDRWKRPVWLSIYRTEFGYISRLTDHYTGSVRGGTYFDGWRFDGLSEDYTRETILRYYKSNACPQADHNAEYAASDQDLQRDCPALAEYMTLQKVEEGMLRQPSSLLVFCQDGHWKGCLSERDQGLVLWASGETLVDLLRALDGLLQDEKTPWRKARQQPTKKPAK